jgi:hypothetical protein
MAFIQYVTCTRPDASIPFFEQTGDGSVRASVQRDIADSLPDLVTRSCPVTMEEDPDILTFTSTFTYTDFGAWAALREMMASTDPTFKEDRVAYYSSVGHTFKIEYLDEGMEDRELLVHVTKDLHMFRNIDGTIHERYPDGTLIVKMPNGEQRIHNSDGTGTVISADGVITNYGEGLNANNGYGYAGFKLPAGIKPPDRYM